MRLREPFGLASVWGGSIVVVGADIIFSLIAESLVALIIKPLGVQFQRFIVRFDGIVFQRFQLFSVSAIENKNRLPLREAVPKLRVRLA
jgi:hypothetical protein